MVIIVKCFAILQYWKDTEVFCIIKLEYFYAEMMGCLDDVIDFWLFKIKLRNDRLIMDSFLSIVLITVVFVYLY